MNTNQDLMALRSQLTGGVATANRRKSRRRIAATAPVIGLVALATVVLRPDDGAPAYALVQRADGTITVDVLPGFDDVETLTADLQAAGLPVEVVQLRSHPSLDGFVEVVSHGNEKSGAMRFDNGQFAIDAAEIEGSIEILIYTAAAEGERYQGSPSIFAPEQPLAGLHCSFEDGPLLAEDVERRATEAGITDIQWTTFGERNEDGSIESETSDHPPAGINLAVGGGKMIDADTLEIYLDEHGDRPASEFVKMTDGTHYGLQWDCTPELAERWN